MSERLVTEGQDYGVILNSQHSYAVRQAISQNGFFNKKTNKFVKSEVSFGKNKKDSLKGKMYVRSIKPLKSFENNDVDVQSIVMQNLSKMGDETADILDILLHLWYKRRSQAQDNYVYIHVNEILKIRGLAKKKSGTGRRGGYKASDREFIANQIDLLRCMWLDISHVVVYKKEGRKGNRKKPRTIRQASPIHAEERIVDGISQSNYCWKIKPGKVFPELLNESLNLQLAKMPLSIFQLHQKNEKYEKRIIRYLTWIWRNSTNNCRFLYPMSVASFMGLVDDLISGHEISDLYNYKPRYPSKIRDRFEKALVTLEEKGFIQDWQWINDPEDITASKGKWFQAFLDCKIRIEPPLTILKFYKDYILKGKRKLPDASHLREVRESQNLSILYLSDVLKVPPMTLIKIDCSYTSPNKSERDRIKNWLKKLTNSAKCEKSSL